MVEKKQKYYTVPLDPHMRSEPMKIRDPAVNNEWRTLLLLDAILQELRILNRREEKRAQYEQ